MDTFFEVGIVIPCYNEANRLQVPTFTHFLKEYRKVVLVFVNDGSTDTTKRVLKVIKTAYPSRVYIIDQPKNLGKAEAVRKGVLTCCTEFHVEKVAYLDADLSTSAEECISVSKEVSGATHFAFGSRIAKLDCTIERKLHRFLIGTSHQKTHVKCFIQAWWY